MTRKKFAIFNHLIEADTQLDQVMNLEQPAVQATAEDYNFDGLQEIRLSNNQLCAWLAPARGGRLYELDIRTIGHNLLATLQRRPENYHQKVLNGPSNDEEDVATRRGTAFAPAPAAARGMGGRRGACVDRPAQNSPPRRRRSPSGRRASPARAASSCARCRTTRTCPSSSLAWKSPTR